VLDQAPMSDQEGIAVTQDTATKYNLKTLSDLAKVSDQLLLGGPPECATRETCLLGLEHKYNMKFKSGKSDCPGGFCKFSEGALRYKALLKNDIQVSVVFTTDGIIAKQHLVVLQDDKGLFPPDHAVPVVRTDFLNKAGGDFTSLVNKISAAITTEEITALNGKVDLDKDDPGDVAKEWLQGKGLL
jgi:glycine betaine/choline ABC-type transport system substrate-binding protein